MHGSVQCLRRFQHLHDDLSQCGSLHPNRNSLAKKLTKKRTWLRAPVKHEYCRVRYSAERIQRAYIARLGEAEGGERRLYARIGIAQQIDILHRAGRVADFQGDAMTLKYPSVLLREVVIARLRHPSGHDQPARR